MLKYLLEKQINHLRSFRARNAKSIISDLDISEEPHGEIVPGKAPEDDIPGRFREIIADPLNLLISRVPHAGFRAGNDVFLHNGIRVAVEGPLAYYGSFSRILVFNRGVHEPLEEFVFQELMRFLPPTPCMVELGAYWAHYSMWMKKCRPGADVYMIEPNPDGLKIGEHNFRRNGLRGTFIQAFVGTGEFELDHFLRERAIGHLEVLHADIQGKEVEMLSGARDALRKRSINYLFISTHSQELHLQVVSELNESGYRVEISSNYETDTTSCDGFVFASSPNVGALFIDFPLLGRAAILQADSDKLIASVISAHAAVRPR